MEGMVVYPASQGIQVHNFLPTAQGQSQKLGQTRHEPIGVVGLWNSQVRTLPPFHALLLAA
jgi:hypothetical protein